MKVSIKWVLVFAFTAIITLSIGFVIVSSYHTSKNALMTHAQSIMKNIITFTMNKSKNHILAAKDAAELTQGLTAKSVVNSENFEGMQEYFFEQLKVNKQFSNIYYANEKGEFVMVSRVESASKDFTIKRIIFENNKREVTLRTTDASFKTINVKKLPQDRYDARKRPWYIMAKKENRTIWTDPYIFYQSQRPGITVAACVLNDDKSGIKGVVGIDIEIQELSNFISKLDFSKNGRIFIFDEKTNMIASDKTKIVRYAVGKNSKLELMKISDTKDKALKIAFESLLKKTSLQKIDKKVFLTFDNNGENYNAIFSPFKINDIKWIIGLCIPENDYLGDIKNNQILNIYIGMFIAFISLLIGYRVSNSISKPIYEMQQVAHELKLHRLNFQKVPLSSFSEISESLEAFNEMQDSLAKYDKETKKLNENLKKSALDTLYRLALAAEYRDQETGEHIHRIEKYSEILAREMKMDEKDIYILKNASLLHDVGKLGIADSILQKPDKLTDEERKIMQTHSLIGEKLLDNPSSEIMKVARQIATYHHEKYDGTGYPYGIKGDNIPLAARIVAVVDVFDALVSKRCYKEAYSIKEALKILNEGRNTHFDPKCLDAFEKSFDKILEVYKKGEAT